MRRLDTARPGRNLLASKVIAAGGHGLGFLQDAYLAPDGRSVIVAAYRNSPGPPGRSGRGVAVLRLAELLYPGSQVTAEMFRERTTRYRGAGQESAADRGCRGRRRERRTARPGPVPRVREAGQRQVHRPSLGRPIAIVAGDRRLGGSRPGSVWSSQDQG